MSGEEVSRAPRARGRALNAIMTRLSRLALLDTHFRMSEVSALLNLMNLAVNHYICVAQAATGFVTLIEAMGGVIKIMHGGIWPGDRTGLRRSCLRFIQRRFELTQDEEEDQEGFLGGFLLLASDCLLCLYAEARQGLVRTRILQSLEDAVLSLRQNAK